MQKECVAKTTRANKLCNSLRSRRKRDESD